MARLTVTKIPKIDTIVIRELDGKDIFIAVSNTIIITPFNLARILKFLVINNFLNIKVLEGVVEEVRSINGN
jgi:hypothetical protein